MPETKEFLEDFDSDDKSSSGGDEETTTTKKSKAKPKDDVSSID
jgi:hypothetical protein